MNLPYELRPWQRIAAMKFAEVAAKRPNCRAIVQAATGGGKSRLCYAIGLALGRRFFIVVHLDILAAQFEKEAKALFPGLKVGVVKAARSEVDADLVVVSAQTMKDTDRIAALKASEERRGAFVLQVHDECHHATKVSVYDRILQSFPDTPALGLSATLNRMDGKDLAECWPDGVCSRYPIQAAQDDGILVPITDGRGGPKNVPHRLVVPGADIKAAVAADKAGDREAARRAVGEVAWPIVAKELAFQTLEAGRLAAVFCPDVESAHIVADHAAQLGVKVAPVDGKIKKKEIRRRLDAHAAGEIRALTSCSLLMEGWDCRPLNSIIWARPTLSQTVYIQGVGRGLRISPETGKIDTAVSDLCGAHDAHGLVTGESLFLDGAATAEPDAAEVAEALETDKKPDEVEDRKTAVWRSFLACLSGSKSLAAVTRSNVLWLPVGKDDRTYALPGADGATYGLEALPDGRWIVVREPRRPKGGPQEPAVRLCRPTTREEAQAVAERAARAGESFDARDAAWRASPASQEQLDALARSRVAVHGALTKGEASDLLTIKSYAAKRWTRRERGVVSGGASAFEVEG